MNQEFWRNPVMDKTIKEIIEVFNLEQVELIMNEAKLNLRKS
jgi:hypothetical protein